MVEIFNKTTADIHYTKRNMIKKLFLTLPNTLDSRLLQHAWVRAVELFYPPPMRRPRFHRGPTSRKKSDKLPQQNTLKAHCHDTEVLTFKFLHKKTKPLFLVHSSCVFTNTNTITGTTPLFVYGFSYLLCPSFVMRNKVTH